MNDQVPNQAENSDIPAIYAVWLSDKVLRGQGIYDVKFYQHNAASCYDTEYEVGADGMNF